MSTDEYTGLEIAIIGMSGRFPGASNLQKFWQNLEAGVESVTFFSDEELLAADIDPHTLRNPNYVRARAVLDDVDFFDAHFFDISPKDAELMDPQHRLFLECAWEALEQAGYSTEPPNEHIGVYAGVGFNSYLLKNILSQNLTADDDRQIAIGNDKDFVSTRISYKLNLSGPSLTVQTACSTSLVAVHLACQSLLSGECDLGLAGGFTIRVPQISGYLYKAGGIDSPDGHCRAFDAQAKGIVKGSGGGVVALRRLEDAVAHGDTIHAIIKGSALTNDGALKAGYTAPGVEGQSRVIAMAHSMAGITAETISYVEAHGTGTALGDPIEIAALTRAFRAHTNQNGFCAIGSVKTNIGHLDAGAGIAGLLKTILSLKHRQIPPSLHFNQPNPEINFAQSPFYINSSLSDWHAPGPLRAGVSSFGIGGTNAHVILQEAPPAEHHPSNQGWHLLTLSAKSETALQQMKFNLAHYLQEYQELDLTNMAYTLQSGRKLFSHRCILASNCHRDAITELTSQHSRCLHYHSLSPLKPVVVFLFPGQGAQTVNMGRELYQRFPSFRKNVDRCCELLAYDLKRDLRELLYPPEHAQQEAETLLQQTLFTQTSLFVIEYSLAQLWISWGILPQAMLGHSLGEYVAACLAGVFSLEDALKLIIKRGQLMEQLPSGDMLSVPLSEQVVYDLLGSDLSLAAVNGPERCVISGPPKALGKLHRQLAMQGIDARYLHTSHAFHSAMMDTIVEPFRQFVAGIQLYAPSSPYLSNVSGSWITPEEATNPDYWAKHLRHCVRFADDLTELLAEKTAAILIEIGPGQTLKTFARQHPATNSKQLVLTSLFQNKQVQSELYTIWETLGQLWMAGIEMHWSNIYAPHHPGRVPLPTYPFERQRYWLTSNSTQVHHPSVPQAKSAQMEWFYLPYWKPTTPLLITESDTRLRSKPASWLLFLDPSDLNTRIVSLLQQTGQQFITVEVGTTFSRRGEQNYLLAPDKSADYHRLLQDLKERHLLPQIIIHTWSILQEDHTDNLFANCQQCGFYSLLYLCQALGDLDQTMSIQLAVVTHNLQAVIGEEITDPAPATLLGACNVIPREYPSIHCQSIDIADATTEMGDLIVAECLSHSSIPTAYRGGRRWTQSFEQVKLEAPNKQTHLRERGTYLITGGMGAVGLQIAEYLAHTIQARIVLIGRSPMPSREEWDQLLQLHDPYTTAGKLSTHERIKRILKLEELGADVLPLCADVSDDIQMQIAITTAQQHFGQIHGVFHIAANIDGGLIQLQTPETVKKDFAPKIEGTLVLDRILGHTSLDFMVLFSSLNAITGSLGLAAYCGACTFIDRYAYSTSRRHPYPIISINWDRWRGLGTAVLAEARHRLLTGEEASGGMLPEQGIDILNRILATRPAPQVIISTHNIQDVFNYMQTMSTTSTPSRQITQSLHPRPTMLTLYVPPETPLEMQIAKIWEEVLGIGEIGVQDDFSELGGDSLLATQVLTRMRETFQLDIPLKDLLEARTIARITPVIQKLQQQDDLENERPALQDDEIEQLLREIEQLTEKEIQAQLLGELGLIEGEEQNG